MILQTVLFGTSLSEKSRRKLRDVEKCQAIRTKALTNTKCDLQICCADLPHDETTARCGTGINYNDPVLYMNSCHLKQARCQKWKLVETDTGMTYSEACILKRNPEFCGSVQQSCPAPCKGYPMRPPIDATRRLNKCSLKPPRPHRQDQETDAKSQRGSKIRKALRIPESPQSQQHHPRSNPTVRTPTCNCTRTMVDPPPMVSLCLKSAFHALANMAKL